jgi:hypothetical protein
LWLPPRHDSVTLLPLVSCVASANVAEGGLLRHQSALVPGIVVADNHHQGRAGIFKCQSEATQPTNCQFHSICAAGVGKAFNLRASSGWRSPFRTLFR